MPNTYEDGQSGKGYIAQGIGGGLSGITEGMKLGHEMQSNDLMRQLMFSRMSSLDQYRNGAGGLLDLKQQMADSAAQNADTATKRESAYEDSVNGKLDALAGKTAGGSKADAAKSDLDEAVKSMAYPPALMPWVTNFRRSQGRMPMSDDLPKPKMSAPAAPVVAPAAGGGGVMDTLRSLLPVGLMGGGAPAAAGAPAPSPAAPAAGGGFDWRKVPVPGQ